MSRYTALSGEEAQGNANSMEHPRPSFTSSRRPSMSSLRFGSRRDIRLPDPDEMDAAFDAPDDAEESHGLLQPRRQDSQHVPGDYDFERDYPPPSPPPFQPYSSHNPAPGNTNGILPTNPARPPSHGRHFLGGILPSSILPRRPSPGVVGAGNTGVFANISARPDNQQHQDEEGNFVPETEQKDGPPSYQAALRDAVPPYWDTTVVLPSSSSPFGPLSSSISGDEILIDGMASGNFFTFFWNVIVSVSFQFVGFLLTYVLHTTHAAKYGSRVGLGLTLIQFGFSTRTKAMDLIENDRFPDDPDNPTPPGTNPDEIAADNALKAFMGGLPWPQPIRDPFKGPDEPPVIIHSTHEAELFAESHNMTLADLLNIPSAAEVGRANEYFSFMLMTIGWFLVLTSVGGWIRVKRFERKLRAAQRESEAAQAEANGTETEPNTVSTGAGPTSWGYYTAAFRQHVRGMNEIRRGFFGMRGRRVRGDGHTPLPQSDEDGNELFDAQSFGLEPMAGGEEGRRGRGLWGT